MLGPRIGKYGADGKPRALAAHSIPMAMLGTFILLFGWFGFNAMSTFAATDVRFAVAGLNTGIAAAFGATIGDVLAHGRVGKPDPGMMCNGMLAGLVAITAPCAFVQPWAAAVIGSLAAIIVIEACWFIEKRGIDDPVGAIGVHGIGGTFGVLCIGIFSSGDYGAGWNLTTKGAAASASGVTGILYDFELGIRQLGSAGDRRGRDLDRDLRNRVRLLQDPERDHEGRHPPDEGGRGGRHGPRRDGRAGVRQPRAQRARHRR